MTTNHTRLTGALLLTALATMVAGAIAVVPSGMTLNPADPAATLAAVLARPEPHLALLAIDVTGWLALTACGLTMAARTLLPGGLLACAGLAGMLHDAGNLAVTRLTDPALAGAVLVTAKWTVNLAGLLWVAATVALLHLSARSRRTGVFAALSGLAAVVLPWLTGPSMAQEQLGYALHLPVMLWYGVFGWRALGVGQTR
jgi:hypothetical protein